MMCESCRIAADGPTKKGKSFERTSPGYKSGQKPVGVARHCCEYPVSCTCMHRRKGAWLG